MARKKDEDRERGENKPIRAFTRLLGKLCKNPGHYDSHPLARKEVLQRLTANIAVTLNDSSTLAQLEFEEGGWALIRALGLVTLNNIWIQLKRTEPDERLTLGLILVWFTLIEPAFSGVKPKSCKKAIVECADEENNAFIKLLKQHILHWSKTHYDWVPGSFKGLTERTAINYREEALAFLLRYIELTALILGKKLEALIPELAGLEPEKPGAAPYTISVQSEHLSKYVADYRSHEMGRIESLLEKEGLTSSFEWFVDRQVYRPVNRIEDADEAPIVSLTELCKPGMRTALLDYRGSGTTTALLWLSWRYCVEEENLEPVVI
ncbi:MAG TPA: hypothetical protein ENF96_00435 [Archaeoglobus veneficus]|nr:hypothetical protein [Archaeoglobus veneficus]